MTRRSFIGTTAGAAGMSMFAAGEPFALGINTYCLRALRWTDAQLLEHAAKLKLDAVFLQDSLDPKAQDPVHWAEVKAMAARLGLTLLTGAGGTYPKSKDEIPAKARALKTQIERAQAMGSKVVRLTLAGDRAGLGPGTTEQYIDHAASLFREVAGELRGRGMKIALETHKELQAWEFALLVETVGADVLGMYLDATNPLYVAEHPLTALERLGKYAVTLHLGDASLYETKRGVMLQRVPLGMGQLPLKELVEKAKVLCPGITVHVKTITGRPPELVPVWEDAFWQRIPGAKAGEFARFLSLARSGGPFEGTMVVEDVAGRQLPPELLPAIQRQQREHIEKGVDYAMRTLDLGRRWRSA